MIVRDRPGLLRLFFILRGSIVPMIYPQVLVVFGVSLAIVLLHRAYPSDIPSLINAPFALLGLALSIFLGFRNNACYDRWWEARKIWGLQVIAVRNFARQTLLLADNEINSAARRDMLELTIAFSHMMVSHLRPGHPLDKALRWMPAGLAEKIAASRNPPDLILREIEMRLVALLRKGRISDLQFRLLDETVGGMQVALGSCERIRHTPVPFGYTLLLHRTAHLFCFFLPFGFADALGWATPFASALVAYTFFGLDALGDQLEEPFGTSPNGLPIATIADVIEINLREALGDKDLPPMPAAVDHILL
ncbi:bestrophin family protein [Rhizobium halophytocola]|uniref:Membrane protein n=1 Tax=Rhizobium halophytocola TaxID=735519 RepID=A0ABS4DX60_9HYPH|nr:bestrophin family ion channel [Rhizobium halophytocola]MBP1850283.1 putative membrane protein [Rhizobium halophytocola]